MGVSARCVAHWLLAVVLAFSATPATAQTPQSTIRTIVGGGPVDAPGPQVVLSQITAVSVGPDGSTYLALRGHAAVYRVSPAGLVTVVAGTGFPGNSGDGGPAVAAKLDIPNGVAADTAGNVYISDWTSGRIRRVAPDGLISTFAGGGGSQLDGVLATDAQLGGPRGLEIDAAGNLLFVDLGFQKVRKVSTAGIVTTVAGNGSTNSAGDGGPAVDAGLNAPSSIAFDVAGNLYIAETGGNRIRKVSPAGTITTLAGTGTFGYSGDGGPATAASLQSPYGVAVDANGNVFIAELDGHRIRKVTPAGTISTVAGDGVDGYGGDGGPATAAQLNNPMGVAIDAAGDLLIADSDNYRLRKVHSDGTIVTAVGDGRNEGAWNAGLGGFSGDGGPATEAQLWSPRGIATDAAGNLFIADELNHRVRKVAPTGIISTLAGTGVPGFSGDGGPATAAQLNAPIGVAVDGSGNVYIADDFNARVRVVRPDGRIQTFAGRGCCGYEGDGGPATEALLFRPRHLAVDSSGNVFIGDSGLSNVRKVTPSGTISTAHVGIGRVDGIALDASGQLLVMDGHNDYIWAVSPSGSVSSIVGTGGAGYAGDGGPANQASVYLPTDAVPDGRGNLFIADGGNNRIRVIRPDGTIDTVAGFGGFGLGGGGFEGDGGPAIDARFNNPMGLAFLPDGRLLIADLSNNRIRAIDADVRTAIVDAGPDQTVEATGVATAVTLRGATSPSDGVPLSFAWIHSSGATLATSLVATIQLPIGRHELRLLVQWADRSAEDGVVVTVVDSTAPEISIASPQSRTYALGQVVPAQFNCSDAATGISACTGSVANAAPIDTATAGPKTFTVTATDNAGNARSVSVGYNVSKAVPGITWPPPVPIAEGTPLGNTQLNAMGSVPGAFAYTPPAGTLLGVGSHTLSVRFTPADMLNYVEVTASVPIEVLAAAVRFTVEGPPNPVLVGRTATIRGVFSAPPPSGSTCTFDWGGGATTTVVVSSSGSVSTCAATWTYRSAGLYEVAVSVAGDGFTASSSYQYVVVYDPNAGILAGAGWIASAPGSLGGQAGASGPALFAFATRYRTGQAAPIGGAWFAVWQPRFAFTSDSIDWLTISGATAHYAGSGRVDGASGYRYAVTAVDGQRPGGGGSDRFRIRIVQSTTGEVVFDNVAGEWTPGIAQPIAGGAIAIQR